MSRFEFAKESFEDGMENAKSSRNRERSQQAHEHIFVDEVIRLIVVLEKTGHGDRAREIQSKALSVLDSRIIRNALNH